MYNVSQGYKDALKSSSHRWKIRCTIGNQIITDENLLPGSLTVTRQCSEGSAVSIGTVYISKLKCTFMHVNVPRNTWVGLTITISEGLLVGNAYEYVPIGVFTVDDAEHTAVGVSVTAYDNMAKLDKNFPTDITQGSAYSMLAFACEKCGVTLGMTQADIQAFPNGNVALALYTENDIETYRDFVSWIAQTLAAFAYIDRDGSLKLKMYGNTVHDSIDQDVRFKGGKFSDYVTRYTGLSVVDFKTESTNYYSVTPDDGLTYNLGSNPLLQYGTESTKKIMRQAVLNGLQNIQYTPFNIDISSGAVYDLGDGLMFPNGLGSGASGCVMYSEWKYKKKTTLKGFGSNPALATARSKTDKNISGLMSKTDKNSIQYYTFMNVEELYIGSREKNVINIRFATIETDKVIFQAEILCDVNTQDIATCTVVYMLDGAVYDYQPVETWINGKHILSLWHVIDVEPNTLYRWQVYLKCDGGLIYIDAGGCRASIWGQGLVSTETWDGYIDCEDTLEGIELDSIGVRSINETMTISDYTPAESDMEDTFGLIMLDDITVVQFEDYVLMNKTSIYLEGMKWEDVYENTWGAIYDEHTW